MAETAKAIPAEPKPTIYLRDEQIDKYLGEGFDSLEMGESSELSFRCKVVGLSKREEPEYDDKGEPTGKTKAHRSVDLELVARDKDRAVKGGKESMQKTNYGGMGS